jgi:hypothetical protein
VNDVSVKSLSDVASVLEQVGPEGSIVLQVERNAQFVFFVFEMD